MCLIAKKTKNCGSGRDENGMSRSMSSGKGEPTPYGDDPKYSPRLKKSANSPKSSPQSGITSDSELTPETVDSRPQRKKWSKDRAKRLIAMTKAMPEFLMAYYGNETPIASAMSVTPVDVREAIQACPELIELQEISVNSVEALLLDHGLHVALSSKNIAGVKWALEVRFPEKYGKTKANTAKNKGFTAPTDDPDDLESVLDIKGEEKD